MTENRILPPMEDKDEETEGNAKPFSDSLDRLISVLEVEVNE